MNDYPVIDLPGSEKWRGSYEWGKALDGQFPGQDAYNFSYACEYNSYGPVQDQRIVELQLIQQGHNEGEAWIWHVVLEDDSAYLDYGGCDYTGWDCQSYLGWANVELEINEVHLLHFGASEATIERFKKGEFVL